MDGCVKTWGKNKMDFPEDFLFPEKLGNFRLSAEETKEVFMDPFSSSRPLPPYRGMDIATCSEKKPLSLVKMCTLLDLGQP